MACKVCEMQRFMDRVEKEPNAGCWLWVGSINANGYGVFCQSARKDLPKNNRTVFAHRYAYREIKGPVPDGLVIDHLCRIRNCVNPDHLEAVTNWENTKRGASFIGKNHLKTHCDSGHEFTVENTGRSKDGKRYCRACKRALAARKYAKKKVQAIHKAQAGVKS